MLKILDIAQLRALDAYTIQHEPVASIDLMERACQAFVSWFVKRFDNSKGIGIVCGTGNNGGDGLGIARLLTEQGYIVCVYIVRSGKVSPDFTTNFDRLQGAIDVNDFDAETPVMAACDVLIDAILGSGLTRPAEGIYQVAIDAINNADAIRVAVDIPSGLFADQHTTGPTVKADYTVSFQLPKLSFLLPESGASVGEWHLADIGLDKGFIYERDTSRFYLEGADVRDLIRKRKAFSHKGNFGHALLIAGSRGKFGAAVLAAHGALRAGAGLLTVHTPSGGHDILQSSVPEAMVSIDGGSEHITGCPQVDGFDVIGAGPGIGQSPATMEVVRKILLTGKPMVIDADALNILSSHRDLLQVVPKGSILTPHPGEFRRLVGDWNNDFKRLDMQVSLARQLNSVVILKGAHTSIATPEGVVFFNSTGNPGMATAGSGDVLTGILTGLMAQGYSAKEAALLGVYLHGLAGDLAVLQNGEHSLIASDLVTFLPAAFMTLAQKGG